MGVISITNPTDGTTADASDIATPLNTIVNEINGNIDNANIKSAAAIAGSKLADASVDLGLKSSVFDGWVAVSDSWAYASATTITIPSDGTTKYSKGDKLKLIQSAATKYFYITGVTSTVLTINGGSDYTLTNVAISSIYYSKATTPLSFPAAFSWISTLTNLSGGTQTFSKFALHGNTVNFRFRYVLAGAGMGTSPTFSLPVAVASDYDVAGVDSSTINYSGQLDDVTGNRYLPVIHLSSTTVASILYLNTTPVYTGITSTAPFTWASGDVVEIHGTYEAA